jgi:hypothetical protein
VKLPVADSALLPSLPTLSDVPGRPGTQAMPPEGSDMTDAIPQTPAQMLIGDFAPKLVALTDDVLFGDVWARPELSPRERSLITVASLITGGNTEWVVRAGMPSTSVAPTGRPTRGTGAPQQSATA